MIMNDQPKDYAEQTKTQHETSKKPTKLPKQITNQLDISSSSNVFNC